MAGNLLYKKARMSCHSGIVAHVCCLGGNKVKSKKTKELGTRKACDISRILCVVHFAKLKPRPSQKAMENQRI